jgi:hypothetical protein
MFEYEFFPLPNRIPIPTPNMMRKMVSMGFSFRDDGHKYLLYKLPHKWKLVDKTTNNNIPEFYFLDSMNKPIIEIKGIWHSSVHKLYIRIVNSYNNLTIEQIIRIYDHYRI